MHPSTGDTPPEATVSQAAIYGVQDRQVVDYQFYRSKRTGHYFRGPKPERLEPNGYFVCLGAAQTLGRFCRHPYPDLLEQRLGLKGVNLGHGGAGASFFLKNEALLDIVEGASFVIVQIMSARSESNSRFESAQGIERLTRRADGAAVRGDKAFGEIMRAASPFHLKLAEDDYYALPFGPPKLKALIAETRRNCVEAHVELLSRLRAPSILLWFSRRKPDYQDRYYKLYRLLNDYPQLVNRSMVEQMAMAADSHLECITDRGMPQLLVNSDTGVPSPVETRESEVDISRIRTHNTYYPSPEMHEDAAAQLEPLCRQIIGKHGPEMPQTSQ